MAASQGEEADGLARFVASMGGERQLRVEENLGEGFVRLRVSEAERRQAKHDIRCIEDVVIELLRNARDAGARNVYVATGREAGMREVTVLDDGCGIPPDMQERVFDARVTSKLDSMHLDRWGVHGRGMALFSVRENAEYARVLASGPGLGTAIRVVCDPAKVSERADQSTWPTLSRDEDGAPVVRGPHNIVRACCEFALEERGTCNVYLGSASEIAATARRRVQPTATATDLLFMDDLSALPVLERLRVAADAGELMSVAASLGLSMSERTAHRIVAGQIRPQRSVASRLEHRTDAGQGTGEVDLHRDRRGLKVSADDLGEFSRIMERDFSYLADRYYLSLSEEPRVRVSRGRVTVTFEVGEGD